MGRHVLGIFRNALSARDDELIAVRDSLSLLPPSLTILVSYCSGRNPCPSLQNGQQLP